MLISFVYIYLLTLAVSLESYNIPIIFIKKSSKSSKWRDIAYEITGDDFRPHKTCLKPDYHKRYRSIAKRKLFLALNVHNNEEILPQMLGNIIELISYVSPKNIFLSIFESGSSDQTKDIMDKFIKMIEPMDIDFEIISSPIERTSQMNRIEYLVYIRNLALEPLFKQIEVLESNSQFADPHIDYDAVVFLNDVYYCINDLIELLYQQALNDAHIVTGMDYDAPGNGLPRFYDTWVAHTTSGKAVNKSHMDRDISDDSETNDRIMKGLPVQMGCLWNGMAVMSIKPFKRGIRFRRGNNIAPNLKAPGECAGSECSTLCLDFLKFGFSKILMVPRVKVKLTDLGSI
eukprot:NODE_146_length_17563_cov_0.253321.p4 type:complete len:345 gc:universal NODE_146_length_17563_cov_0.253321:13755-14789(+)